MAKRKLLLLNRRCIKNPLGGGAEVYTHELFERLSDEYDITYFTSSFKDAKSLEVIDSIKYIRKGGELSMHLWGWRYYRKNKSNFDIIIDQFNGLGFMTMFNKKSIMLIHQLYDEFWVSKLGFVGNIFRFVEKILLRIYNNMKVITVSESTRDDLLTFGFKKENIFIVYNGIDYVKHEPKIDFPMKKVTYLGRMEATKNPKDLLEIYDLLSDKLPGLLIQFVGGGSENERLKNISGENKNIIFHGFVSEEEKYKILRETDILVVPSIREGWGQIVIQANMMGTPVVAYRVAGIKDSVKHNYSGILVEPNNVDELASEIEKLLTDREKLEKFSLQALERSSHFSWENSSNRLREYLKNI